MIKKLILITGILLSTSLWADDKIYLSCEVNKASNIMNLRHGHHMWISISFVDNYFAITSTKMIEERGDVLSASRELEVSANFYKAKGLRAKLNRTSLRYGSSLGDEYASCINISRENYSYQVKTYLQNFKANRKI